MCCFLWLLLLTPQNTSENTITIPTPPMGNRGSELLSDLLKATYPYCLVPEPHP